MLDIEQANQTAVDRMMSARPILRTVARAADVIPGMGERLLLHAGPPITWARASGPMRGAIIGACIFEGWAARRCRSRGARDLRARSRSSPATITAPSARWPASRRRR